MSYLTAGEINKTFQVTDMMVANATNLIITVKPASQKNNIQKSYKSDPRYPQSNPPNQHQGSDSDSDGDEVRDLSQYPGQSEKSSDKHVKRFTNGG